MNNIFFALWTLSWACGLPTHSLQSSQDYKSNLPQLSSNLVGATNMSQQSATTQSHELAVVPGSISIDIPDDQDPEKKLDKAKKIIVAHKQKKVGSLYHQLGAYLQSLGICKDVQNLIFEYIPLVPHNWIIAASFDTVIYHNDACVSADSQSFYLSDGCITTWNINNSRARQLPHQLLHQLPQLKVPNGTKRITCSPDGKYTVALSYHQDESAIFRNLPNEYKKIGSFDAKSRKIGEHSEIVFSASGDYFLYDAGAERGITVCDIQTNRHRALIAVKEINSLALAPDEKTVAYAEPQEITVRDIGSLTIRAQFKAPDKRKIYKIIFSPDGSNIIAGSDGMLIMCNIEKKERQLYPTKYGKISEIIATNRDLIFGRAELYILPNFFPNCAYNQPELLDTLGTDSIRRLSKAQDDTFLSLTYSGMVKIWKNQQERDHTSQGELVEIQTTFTPKEECREWFRAYGPCCLYWTCFTAGMIGLIIGMTVK